MGKRYDIPEAVIERARAVRLAGATWGAVGRAVGIDPDVIRWRIDGAFRAHKSGKPASHVSPMVYSKFSQADIDRLLRTVPRDTRSMSARAFGDPLPGRSALDRKRQSAGQAA
jgi:transposase-like protein